MLSIENFNPSKRVPPYLDSPRSLEACARQGIDPEELLSKPKGYFRKVLGSHAPKAIVRMHKEHYEARRLEKLARVQAERDIIIREGGSSPTGSKSTTVQSTNKNHFLIEHEKRKIERLQRKQEQEVQQMLQHERVMEDIRKRNEEKEKFAQQREEYHLRQIEATKKENEERRLREEERKRELEQAREQEIKDLQQQHFQQEQRKLREDQVKSAERKRVGRQRDLQMQLQNEKLKMQTERILEEQRTAVELRRQEMDVRDAERRRNRETMQKQMKARSAAIRKSKQERLATAQSNLNHLLEEQRNRFEAKQRTTEERRLQFERQREIEKLETVRKAEEKKQEIERILMQSQKIEAQKKQDYLDSMQRAEARKQELEVLAERERKQKLREEKHREEERIQVRIRMQEIETQRKTSVFQKMQETDAQVKSTKARQAWENRLRQEEHLLRRKDREEEVQRVMKVQEYQKRKTIARIKSENAKTETVLEEKRKLMETRLALRRKMEQQKLALLNKFEKMKKKPGSQFSSQASSTFKGVFSASAATESTPRVKSEKREKNVKWSPRKSASKKSIFAEERGTWNNEEHAPTTLSTRSGGTRRSLEKGDVEKQLYALKRKKNHVMKEELEFEQRKEEERDQMLAAVTNLKEKSRLEKIFGLERAKASERLDQLAFRFDQDIEALRQSLQPVS